MTTDELRPEDSTRVRVQRRGNIIDLRRIATDRPLYELVQSVEGPWGECPTFREVSDDTAHLKSRILEWLGDLDSATIDLLSP